MDTIPTLHFGLTELLIASAWCFGFYKAFSEGMIFERLDLWATKHFPDWLYKPTIGCTICMASLHGFTFYTLFVGLDWQVILFVVCLSGLNAVISSLSSE